MLRARLRKQFPAGPGSAAFSLELDLSAEPGVTVLFGPSGAGKTLTLDAIAGFVRPEQGRILLDDQILFDGAARVSLPPRQRHCGYVFQSYALFPNMTLRRNLEFALHGRPRLERHRRVNQMLERFHLDEMQGRRPHELSGGQKQRCSIARALIGAPRILLLDEPARGLDAPLRAELYGIIRQVRDEYRIPIVLVTHDLDECIELGDEIVVVRDGRAVQSGTPREVFDRPASVEVAQLLGLHNLLSVEILALDPGRKVSRVRYMDCELGGPYFPGHLIGDRVWLCVRPRQLTAAPRAGRPAANQIPVTLERVVERVHGLRLEFSGDLAVEDSNGHADEARRVKDWVVEIPPAAMRVL
jgi:molybdate transport system ATP-binding protein